MGEAIETAIDEKRNSHLNGELVMIVTGEQLIMKEEDEIIQSGAAHAWHNYPDEGPSIEGIMIGGEFPKFFKRLDTVQPDESIIQKL